MLGPLWLERRLIPLLGLNILCNCSQAHSFLIMCLCPPRDHQSLQEEQWKPDRRANQPPSVTVSWLLTSRPKKTDHFSTIYGLLPSSCAPVCMVSLIWEVVDDNELNQRPLPPVVTRWDLHAFPPALLFLEAGPKGHIILPGSGWLQIPQHQIIYSELRNYIHYDRISRKRRIK